MTHWFENDTIELEGGLDARQVLKDEFLTCGLVDFAISE